MSLHFLVTSAIQTSHGIFTPQERFEQTMNTIGSIQKYEPTAGISIIEMSSEPVDEEFASKLQEHCEYYFDYNNDTNVKSIFEKWPNQSCLKNLTETYVLSRVFADIAERQLFDSQSEIFKISGRYFLTDLWHEIRTEFQPNSICIAESYEDTWERGLCNYTSLYPTTYFSFPAALLMFMSETCRNAHSLILDHLNQGRYCDFEHSLYGFLPKEWVKEIHKIQGNSLIEGLRSPDGNRN